MTINWKEVPYDHSGRWEKKYDSIMNPNGAKITWPQFIMEMVVFWRIRILKNYKDVRPGPEWWKGIARDVRGLTQQASSICNYFPHPDDEPLVINAFKSFFRKNRVIKIGQFRKTRVTAKGTLNVTQDEKDVIQGVNAELQRLIKQRDSFLIAAPMITTKTPEEIRFKTQSGPKKGGLAALLELEQKVKSAAK